MKHSLNLLVLLAIISCSKKGNPDKPNILPSIDFSYNLTENGKVEFKNKSTNLNSFEWSFGDFSPNGFSKDTVHTYLENKIYAVQLLGKNESGKAYKKDSMITINNRNVPIDSFKYNCDSNIFGLNTNFGEFCSRYSEYGSVILSKHKLGRQFNFWYTFAEDRNSSFSNYEFSLVTSLIINDVGTYEFSPKQSNERIFEANSAWIEVHYDSQKQIPWAFTFITPQKIKLNIYNVTEEFISGSLEMFIDDQLKFNGNFKNLKVKKQE